jgi:hypothetical protein
MSLKLWGFEFNKYALAVTCSFLPTLVWFVSKFFFTSLHATALAVLLYVGWFLQTIVAGIAGLKESHMFGGRKNFTGRLLFFFSLGIFMTTIFYLYDALLGFQVLPSSFILEGLLAGSGAENWLLVLIYVFPAYALVTSVRSLWNGYDSKSLLVIICSVAFATVVGWANFFGNIAAGTTTLADSILWVGIAPTLAFLELASGVLLLRSLGKWYVAKSMTAFVLAVLFAGVVFQLASSIVFTWFATASNLDVANYWSNLIGNIAIFLVCIAITQIKPRMTGPFF